MRVTIRDHKVTRRVGTRLALFLSCLGLLSFGGDAAAKRGPVKIRLLEYAERKTQPLWKEKAPPARIIQLSKAILGIRMEEKDTPGEYLVKAKVCDLNADISFELEARFRLK